MTDEQIKQKAEEYFNNDFSKRLPSEVGNEELIKEAYIIGAHSRDEEINHWKESYEELAEIANVLQTEIQTLMIENAKLRNPWISVKDRLPEMFVDSKGIVHDFSVKILVTNENNPNYWHVAEYYPDKNEWCCLEHPTYIINDVTHWMSIPDIH